MTLTAEGDRRARALDEATAEAHEQRLDPAPLDVPVGGLRQDGIERLSVFIVHALNDSKLQRNAINQPGKYALAQPAEINNFTWTGQPADDPLTP